MSAVHALPAHEAVLLLDTDPHNGLTAAQAADRRNRFGPNSLPAADGDSLLVRILRQFHHPLIYVLLAAAVITALLREYVDSAVIFAVVVVNAIVGFIQESKAESALEGLRSMVHTDAKVVRDGHEQMVPSEDLVPGDLVLLEAGDKVPADLRLLRDAELQVNESALTGESVPASKNEAILAEDTVVADRTNMVYSGTLVTAGSAAGIVVATGGDTELGEIHRLVGGADALATPLTAKLARFSKLLTVVILALAALTFVAGLLRHQDPVETFTAAIALAVGAIPEGLPAAVTITLAIGVSRMAKRRAVIRRLPAVETLGGTTVICTDKTGTLTQNEMTVEEIWTPGGSVEVSGTGYAPDGSLRGADQRPVSLEDNAALRWSLAVGTCCNDAALSFHDDRWDIVGDPTEGALLSVAAKAGIDRDVLAAECPRVDVLPFSSERQFMATLNQEPGGGYVVLVKGGVERVLERCSTQMARDGRSQPLQHEEILRQTEALSSRGLRVLATAIRRSTDRPVFGADSLGDLTLTGLQAMLDPPRAAAVSAVAACHGAGIDVKMITGDHAGTAASIARQVGVLRPESASAGVLTGSELAEIDDHALPDAVQNVNVFARVSPEQKLRLVKALQDRGHVVAMTGDGVNDAPALQQANIGVAMGRGGTEVAKDASDMVLTDDDFATIEAAVEEGRGVFDNLTKFITWTLPTNIGEGLVILVAIALGSALPILPTQILWINMTTAVALGLMLAFEPKEAGIMDRPPRRPSQPLLTGALMFRIVLVAGMMVASSWWIFEWELRNGAGLPEARTAALNLFVAVEVFYLFSCRSLTQSAFRIGFFSNKWIIVGVSVQILAQLVITYLPFLNSLFGTAPIGPAVWLRVLAVAAAVTVVVAIDKRLRRSAPPQLAA